MKLYFAYGANLNRDSMSWRCPRARPLRALYLQDWQLEFSTHATVRPQPGAAVAGALWEITPECEHSLDRFEGYPVYYDKHCVSIDGQEVMLYVMQHARPALPNAGYLTTIAEGYADWNLDTEYLWHAVRSTEETIDDLHWSTARHTTDSTGLDISQPRLDPGHDLGHLRDLANTN